MEAVGQLTGGIAHDFNNMLPAISGSLEFIKRRIALGPRQDVGKYLDAAVAASRQRAADLTQRLLAFARRQSLESKPVDVNKLVHSMGTCCAARSAGDRDRDRARRAGRGRR